VRGPLSARRQPERETAERDLGAADGYRNRARAEGFCALVAAAGECWPQGWAKGRRFVRTRPDGVCVPGCVVAAQADVEVEMVGVPPRVSATWSSYLDSSPVRTLWLVSMVWPWAAWTG
jgi:hypothetical protein